jgi:hypothetical protein
MIIKFAQLKVRPTERERERESQSYITTDSQSVSIAQSGTFDQRSYFFDFFLKLLSCHLGAPSLTKGRVCHLSVFVNTVYSGQYLQRVRVRVRVTLQLGRPL